MVQCTIVWLIDWDYVHWDLTLSREENEDATYYSIAYWATTTTTTNEQITIPFTTWWLVTYQVSACDWSWCSIPTSISVLMMQSNVSWIVNTWYTCWDMTISWNAVTWADLYNITYWSPTIAASTTSTSIVIPFTTAGSQTYSITASNSNGTNTGWSASFTAQSCGISWLTFWSYTCWAVTLDWNDVATATSYLVSYGGTSTTITSSTITIPYTSPWLITYTIEAFNGWSLLTTATISVTMVNCSDFFGNLYVQQVWPTWLVSDWTLTIIGNNNPSNPILDTTYFDTLWFGEVAWFSGTMNCDWVRQDPTTKKVFYWNSLWLYVWQPWKKTVTQLSSISWWTQPVRDRWSIWFFNVLDWKLYKWTDTSLWTLKATYTGYSGICSDRWWGIALWSPTLTPWVLDANWWASYSIYWGNSEITPVSVTPYTLTNWTTQPANIMFRSWQFYAWHSRVWWYGWNPISGLAAALTSTWCGTLSIRQMKAYGEYLYIIYDFNGSEIDLTLSGSYYKPSINTQAAIVKIRTARVTSLYDSRDYEIVNTGINTLKQTEYYTIWTKKYYPSRITSFSVNTAPDWYIYAFWVWSFSEVAPTSDYWIGKWFAMKLSPNGTYAWEITQIPLWYNWTVCDWHNVRRAEAFRI